MINERIASVIEATFSADISKYVANKRRGGDNGAKGVRYEDLYFVAHVVRAASLLVDNDGAECPHLTVQCYGFVDDVRIAKAESTVYCQLKDSSAVTWGGSEHSLASDFANQIILSAALDEPSPHTRLVVSTSAMRDKLCSSIPSEISTHTEVELFASWPSPSRLVAEDSDLRDSLTRLTRMPNPSADELIGVFGALLMASLEFPAGATVDEIVEAARAMHPAQIRIFPPVADGERWLTVEFKEIVASIAGLKYSSERGHFRLHAFGMSYIFPWAMNSDEFARFQQNIVACVPTTVSEFERFYQ